MRKITIVLCTFILTFFVYAIPALAHVTVKPKDVGTAERTNFVVSVPTEEDNPTVAIKLLIPAGVESVRPNVKPGWTIELKKTGEGEAARVTEIVWGGGEIPVDQRDEFVFSAQAPSEEGTLIWKAYQTYESGKEVAWDADPKTVKEHSDAPKEEEVYPYSETKVVKDVAVAQATMEPQEQSNANNLMVVGIVAALVMSGASLWMQTKKK